MAYFGWILVAWLISAFVALSEAPRGRGGEFFLLTLFFLGPLGVGFAAVAQREPVVPGRHRLACPRCTAEQYVEFGVYEFDCWRCHQDVEISYPTLGGPSVQPASKPSSAVLSPAAKTTRAETTSNPKAATKSTPAGKTTRVKCVKCQHTQKIPVSVTSFQCEECNAKLKRAKTS
jgi:hypothetical protein